MRTPLLPAAAIVGIAAAMIAAPSSVPLVQAQTRITVPGAGPLYYPNVIKELPLGRLYMLGTRGEDGEPLSVVEGYDVLNHMIGENWFGPSTPQVVDYPASMGLVSLSPFAPVVDDAVETGRLDLDARIRAAVDKAKPGEPVVIAGLSEGTLVIDRELAYLATDPDAPPADSLSFVMFSNPELGVFRVFMPIGATLPLVNYTAQDLPDSQYKVDVVFHQYDAWADFPDRPWNLVADVNALFGTAYFHNSAAVAVPTDAVVVSSKDKTTTYMIPSSTLPMLKPLEQLGVPSPIVDALNSGLKPIVDAGYSRLTPDAGPHLSHGQLEGLPAPLASPKDAPTSARFRNDVRSAVDAIRNSDSRYVLDSTTHLVRTPARTNPDSRADAGARAAIKNVVEGVKKRLSRLADVGVNYEGPQGFSRPVNRPVRQADPQTSAAAQQ
jgi:hypothetical protein